MGREISRYGNLLSITRRVVKNSTKKFRSAEAISKEVQAYYFDPPPKWVIRSLLKRPDFILTNSGWTLDETTFTTRRASE